MVNPVPAGLSQGEVVQPPSTEAIAEVISFAKRSGITIDSGSRHGERIADVAADAARELAILLEQGGRSAFQFYEAVSRNLAERETNLRLREGGVRAHERARILRLVREALCEECKESGCDPAKSDWRVMGNSPWTAGCWTHDGGHCRASFMRVTIGGHPPEPPGDCLRCGEAPASVTWREPITKRRRGLCGACWEVAQHGDSDE